MDDRRSAKEHPDLSPPGSGRRGIFALGASIAAHALALLAIAYFATPAVHPRADWIILHVGPSGTGAGTNPGSSGRGAALARLEAPKSESAKPNHGKTKAPVRRRIVRAHTRPHTHKRVRRRTLAHREKPRVRHAALDALAPHPAREAALAPVTPPAPEAPRNDTAAVAPAKPMQASTSSKSGPQANGGGAASSGHGNGLDHRGSGTGAGLTSAYAHYGEDPIPDYPEEARRLNEQGTVLLRVLVETDGSVKRVEIVRSSGFEVLDDAARKTVLARWRFVAARKGGVPVESWVRVPIRFALTEADAGF